MPGVDNIAFDNKCVEEFFPSPSKRNSNTYFKTNLKVTFLKNMRGKTVLSKFLASRLNFKKSNSLNLKF